jgi:hypothetical protein
MRFLYTSVARFLSAVTNAFTRSVLAWVPGRAEERERHTHAARLLHFLLPWFAARGEL